MTGKNYSQRAIVDKLGIRPGAVVILADSAWPVATDLRQQILDRAGRPSGPDGELADVVLVTVDDTSDVVALLRHWRTHLDPSGGIWLLTPKRGRPGYVDQCLLIERGPEAGLVDNKVCSVSDRVSAIRFVLRRADR